MLVMVGQEWKQKLLNQHGHQLIPGVVSKRGKKDKDNPYVYRPNQNVHESTLNLMLLMDREMSDETPKYVCQNATNFVELFTSINNKYIMNKG
eukprot:12829973-Ditylum_brightwellii.AAC.1